MSVGQEAARAGSSSDASMWVLREAGPSRHFDFDRMIPTLPESRCATGLLIQSHETRANLAEFARVSFFIGIRSKPVTSDGGDGRRAPVVDQATRTERRILANVPVGQLLLSLGAEAGTLRHRLCLGRGHVGRAGGTRDCRGCWWELGKCRQPASLGRPGGTVEARSVLGRTRNTQGRGCTLCGENARNCCRMTSPDSGKRDGDLRE